ncbi:MAG: 2-oxoacid:acceptor oxidoreductase family protein, partial [Gammaproteobacteria bacterium]|nr:2-oxoacid:acceptor oxidoreductase family protein [Gammaproteobacteria bacterium]
RKSEPPVIEGDDPAAGLVDPVPAEIDGSYNILLTGIGGSGVVTVGANLGMAAHIEGKACSVLDQTGLSQKNGAVMSHVTLSNNPDAILGTRIGTGMSDLVIGFDMVVAAAQASLNTMNVTRSRAVVNDNLVPLAVFAEKPDLALDATGYSGAIENALGSDRVDFFNATQFVTRLLGDSMSTNVFLLGYAYQKGYLPLKASSLETAIRLNNVAVDLNLRAFAWGRVAAAQPERLTELAGPVESRVETEFDLDQFIADREVELEAYQDKAYAERYRATLDRVKQVDPGDRALSEAVARSLYKLMAYKDEYEVARLYTDGRYLEKLSAQFDGDYQIKLHFAPPLFASKDRVTGVPRKKQYGPLMWKALKLMAPLKVLRGTPFDPFGYLQERKEERQLIVDYENTLDQIIDGLTADNYQTAVKLAALPLKIRGYGHVKSRAIEEVKVEGQSLVSEFEKN